MTNIERAKQFANSFDPLKGFAQELRKMERIVVAIDKAELSEDKRELLDITLSELSVGNMAEIVYYSEGEYIKITGILTKKDTEKRFIRIVNTKIDIDDIYDIKKV